MTSLSVVDAVRRLLNAVISSAMEMKEAVLTVEWIDERRASVHARTKTQETRRRAARLSVRLSVVRPSSGKSAVTIRQSVCCVRALLHHLSLR